MKYSEALRGGKCILRKVYSNENGSTAPIAVQFSQVKVIPGTPNELLAVALGNDRGGATMTATASFKEDVAKGKGLLTSKYFGKRDVKVTYDDIKDWDAITADHIFGKEGVNIEVKETLDTVNPWSAFTRQNMTPVGNPDGQPALINGQPYYRHTRLVIGTPNDDFSLTQAYQAQGTKLAPAKAGHVNQ